LPLLRFAVSATGGAHLCSIQYYLRFWLGICRTSLAVSALRIMRYCPKFSTFQVHPGGSMHEPCRYALFSGTVCIILSENTFVKYMFRMQDICI
ncbi:MAG: hypothetical protein MR806_00400, partial [Subdoligranulum sp.]|nr:hypothetical protein [Subdoligranulum sp.]